MTKSEQEVHIWKCADESEWTIYTTDPLWTRRLRVLAHKTGGREVYHQGGAKFFLPASQVRITARRQATLTPEERERRRERMTALRSAAL
jgi:hypothetical protein